MFWLIIHSFPYPLHPHPPATPRELTFLRCVAMDIRSVDFEDDIPGLNLRMEDRQRHI